MILFMAAWIIFIVLPFVLLLGPKRWKVGRAKIVYRTAWAVVILSYTSLGAGIAGALWYVHENGLCQHFSGDDSGDFPDVTSPDSRWHAYDDEHVCGLLAGDFINSSVMLAKSGGWRKTTLVDLPGEQTPKLYWQDNHTLDVIGVYNPDETVDGVHIRFLTDEDPTEPKQKPKADVRLKEPPMVSE